MTRALSGSKCIPLADGAEPSDTQPAVIISGEDSLFLARLSTAARRIWSMSVHTGLFLLMLGTAMGQLDPSAGIQPFSTQVGGQYDSIDLATSNISLTIPIIKKDGKTPFSYQLVGNYHAYIVTPGAGNGYFVVSSGIATTLNEWGGGLSGTPVVGNLGAGALGAVAGGFVPPNLQDLGVWVSYTINYISCVNPNNGQNERSEVDNGFEVIDPTGAAHGVGLSVNINVFNYADGGCGGGPIVTGSPAQTIDGSGYQVVATLNPAKNGYSVVVYDRSGNKQSTLTIPSGESAQTADPDSVTASLFRSNTSGVTTYTDTLGQTVLTSAPGTMISRNGAPDVYTYTDVNGNPQSVQVNYTQYTQKTNFGCADYPQSGLGYFPTSVVLADGETYGISYEATPGYSGDITGRIAKLTLPNGGYIAYGYSGGDNGIDCEEEEVPVLTRTISDNNGNVGTWTYSSVKTPHVPGYYTTDVVTETDPLGNTTTYQFYNNYLTEKLFKDVNLGTLSTTVTCYNGFNTNQSACISPTPSTFTTALTIFQTDVYTTVGASTSLVETVYDHTSGVVGASVGDLLAAGANRRQLRPHV